MTAVPSSTRRPLPRTRRPRMWSLVTTILVLCAACVMATATLPTVARPQDSTLATSPNTPPAASGGTMSETQESSDALGEDMPARRGRGGRARRGGGRANRAVLVTRILGVLTLLGAAGAAYAIIEVRRLNASIARLQDTVSSQARQLDDMRRSRTGA